MPISAWKFIFVFGRNAYFTMEIQIPLRSGMPISAQKFRFVFGKECLFQPGNLDSSSARNAYFSLEIYICLRPECLFHHGNLDSSSFRNAYFSLEIQICLRQGMPISAWKFRFVFGLNAYFSLEIQIHLRQGMPISPWKFRFVFGQECLFQPGKVLLQLGMLRQPGMLLLQQPGMFGSSFSLEFSAYPSAWNIASPSIGTVNKTKLLRVSNSIYSMYYDYRTLLNQHVEKTNSPSFVSHCTYIFMDSGGGGWG